MCWLSKSKPIERMADKDIVVYKIVSKGDRNGNVLNYFYNGGYITYYKGNESEKINISPIYVEYGISDNYYIIEEGYHSYSLDCRMHLIMESLLKFKEFDVFSNSEDSKLILMAYYIRESDRIGKFVIPKGSKYYLNDKGEYVSDNIKFMGSKRAFDFEGGDVEEFLKEI
jgi:hypothetical protein